MKLAYSPASPYVRKVTACAIARGINDKVERWKVGTTDPALLGFNPLSKVPTLITDDGLHLYDSPVICEYLDSVADGVIPRLQANELCIIAMIWIDPSCADNPNLDRKDLYRTNYEAMKLAISRAMSNSPSIDELIANRHKIFHEMYDPETGESQW